MDRSAWRRRRAPTAARPLLVVRRRPRLRPLPRRGLGHADARRPRAVRAAVPRGVPGRSVVDHDPAQAGRRSGPRSTGFDPEVVAAYGDDDVARLMADAGIVRNRAKVEATIGNARALLELHDGGGSLDELVWTEGAHRRGRGPPTIADIPPQTPEALALSKRAQEARLHVRRPDDRLRVPAVRRRRRRPPRGMLPSRCLASAPPTGSERSASRSRRRTNGRRGGTRPSASARTRRRPGRCSPRCTPRASRRR